MLFLTISIISHVIRSLSFYYYRVIINYIVLFFVPVRGKHWFLFRLFWIKMWSARPQRCVNHRYIRWVSAKQWLHFDENNSLSFVFEAIAVNLFHHRFGVAFVYYFRSVHNNNSIDYSISSALILVYWTRLIFLSRWRYNYRLLTIQWPIFTIVYIFSRFCCYFVSHFLLLIELFTFAAIHFTFINWNWANLSIKSKRCDEMVFSGRKWQLSQEWVRPKLTFVSTVKKKWLFEAKIFQRLTKFIGACLVGMHFWKEVHFFGALRFIECAKLETSSHI